MAGADREHTGSGADPGAGDGRELTAEDVLHEALRLNVAIGEMLRLVLGADELDVNEPTPNESGPDAKVVRIGALEVRVNGDGEVAVARIAPGDSGSRG